MKGLDFGMICSPMVAQTIANSLGDWKQLARCSGLDEATIIKIEKENYNDYNEQKYQCIYHWIQYNGVDATMNNLLKIIYYNLEEKILVQSIVKLLGTKSHLTRSVITNPYVYKGDEKVPTSTSFNETDFMKYMEGFDVDMTFCQAVVQTIASSLLQWKSLGRYLGLDEATIMKIERENPHDYEEQKYQCIYHWFQSNGSNSKIINLLRIIYYKLEDKILLQNIVQSLGTNTLVARSLHDNVFLYKGAHKNKIHPTTEFNEADFREYLEELNDLPFHPAMTRTISLCLVQWKPLARYLGVDEATIMRIERENPKDYNEQKYQCVCHLFQSGDADDMIASLFNIIYYKLKDKALLQSIIHSFSKKYYVYVQVSMYLVF